MTIVLRICRIKKSTEKFHMLSFKRKNITEKYQKVKFYYLEFDSFTLILQTLTSTRLPSFRISERITIYLSASTAECQTLSLKKPGSDYTGKVSKTATGLTCQMWNQQSPHKHKMPALPHNYCRNPDGEPGGVWCYTTDPNKRWEYCYQINGKDI